MTSHYVNNTLVLSIAMVLSSCGGCGLLKPTPAADIIKRVEPGSGIDYVLYQPTGYRSDREWPLIIVCHNQPWDRPRDAIADWAALAEEHDIVLAAPALSGSNYQASEEQLRQDEDVVLGVVKHVRASCRIARDRIVIAGMSNAARPAAFIGLRNPGLFRNVVMIKPHFGTDILEKTAARIDPYQKVLVVVGMGDLRKGTSRECLDWLYEYVDVSEVDSAMNPGKFPEIAYHNVQLMQRRDPWIHMGVYELGPPNRLRFQVTSSFRDVYRYKWDFGDGGSAVVAAPEHTFTHSGEYIVTLEIEPERGTVFTRQISIVITP